MAMLAYAAVVTYGDIGFQLAVRAKANIMLNNATAANMHVLTQHHARAYYG
jgi:hypothetical protein